MTVAGTIRYSNQRRNRCSTGDISGGFSAEEDVGTKGFVQTVSADDWIRRVSSERFAADRPEGTRVGFANVKGKKLVRAGVALDGETIVRAMVAGDMHISPPEAMDRVATALEGGSIGNRDDLRARARSVFEQPDVDQPDEAAGITADDVAEAVLLAAKNAR